MARLSADLLDLPAARGARLVARELLGRARTASRRLAAPDDAEALHDFRVALRRLRSWVRAYRSCLGKSVPKRSRRVLNDLAAATNAGRDAEVQLSWVERAAQDRGRDELPGIAWLTGRLEERRDQAYRRAVRHVRASFDRLEQSLRTKMRRRAAGDPERFGHVTASLVQAHATALRDRLGKIGGAADESAIHAARIGAKRLRYLLEPLQQYREEAGGLLRRPRSLQDLLGELHDLHLMAAEFTNPKAPASAQSGLAALQASATQREADLFAALQAEWLDAAAGDYFSQLDALARSLLVVGRVAREIEHKYLLSAVPPEIRETASEEIHQGWLPGTALQERLRAVCGSDGEHYYRCVGAGSGSERLDLTEETTKELFQALWSLTEGKRLAKRRYRRLEGNLVWEVDEFRDRDLILAEVGVPVARKRVPLPAWLRPLVVRDVTREPAYLGVNLAR